MMLLFVFKILLGFQMGKSKDGTGTKKEKRKKMLDKVILPNHF
jgi:hypothetical protein